MNDVKEAVSDRIERIRQVELIEDALHDQGLGCDVRPNQHGVLVDWAHHLKAANALFDAGIRSADGPPDTDRLAEAIDAAWRRPGSDHHVFGPGLADGGRVLARLIVAEYPIPPEDHRDDPDTWS